MKTGIVDIRRADDRFHTRTGWLDSYHSFSFIRQRGAVLWGGQLKPGETQALPDAKFVHLYVAKGAATLEGAGPLNAGDAVRLTGADTLRLTADSKQGAEVLIWEMNDNA